MELSDDEKAEYEQELEALDVKALLVAQTAELREIRHCMQLLVEPERTQSDAAEDTTDLWVCEHCGAEVSEEDRRDHADNVHNAPPGDGVLEQLFSRV